MRKSLYALEPIGKVNVGLDYKDLTLTAKNQ